MTTAASGVYTRRFVETELSNIEAHTGERYRLDVDDTDGRIRVRRTSDMGLLFSAKTWRELGCELVAFHKGLRYDHSRNIARP